MFDPMCDGEASSSISLREKVDSINLPSAKRTATPPRQVPYYLYISSAWNFEIKIPCLSKQAEKMPKHSERGRFKIGPRCFSWRVTEAHG
jgi:hypothetical protein